MQPRPRRQGLSVLDPTARHIPPLASVLPVVVTFSVPTNPVLKLTADALWMLTAEERVARMASAVIKTFIVFVC